MCRRSSGASFVTTAILARRDLAVIAGQELVAGFESSEGVRRHFCSRCGSPLYTSAEASPDTLWLQCGTLDGDPRVRPSFHIQIGSRAPWVEIADDLEKFEGAAGPADLRRLYFSEP
jgi:hypothetical protein